MLNVDLWVKQLRLSHVHKIFNETGQSYLSEHFIKASNFHHHFTRGSTENFVVPYVRGVAATTFYFSAIKDWNSLPSHVKQNALSMDSNVLQNDTLELNCNLWKRIIRIYIINRPLCILYLYLRMFLGCFCPSPFT